MLKASRLGKLVVKLVKDPPSPGEPTPPSTRPFLLVRPGQNASGYTTALVEPKMRSPQHCTYVLQPFCLESEISNRVDISNVWFMFFFGIVFGKYSHQGHGSEYRTKVAPAHKLGRDGYRP